MAAFLLLAAAGFAGVFLAERGLRGQSWTSVSRTILVVAALLRCLLLPVPPTLSEDIERYVWDGRVLGAGFNPYLVPPLSEELTPLRDELWERLPHRRVPTVYPPLAQALFALSAKSPAPVYSLKAILAGIDLGTCALLLLLARLWSRRPEAVLWYAWNPLVTVEIAGMGHIDGLGVTLAVLATALLALYPRRLSGAALTAAGAVLTKLVPILGVPVWGRQSGRAATFLAVTLALCLVGLLPVLISSPGLPPGLMEYGLTWEFNGPLFEPLWRLLDRIDLSSAVESGLDRLKRMTDQHDFWNLFYPFNYPQLWAKAMLSVGLLAALIWSWRTQNPLLALARVFGSMLVFSATVYPWYALWVLPWAALLRHRAWLALSGLLLLTYLPRAWDVSLFPWIQALVWVPFFAIMSAGVRWSTR